MTTTRETLRTTAHANGWTIDERGATDNFDRSGAVVSVRYSVRGGIVVAARKTPGARHLDEIPGAGKSAQVAELLAAADTYAAIPPEVSATWQRALATVLDAHARDGVTVAVDAPAGQDDPDAFTQWHECEDAMGDDLDPAEYGDDEPQDAGPMVCAECGTSEAGSYRVTYLGAQDDPTGRTEVCEPCAVELEDEPAADTAPPVGYAPAAPRDVRLTLTGAGHTVGRALTVAESYAHPGAVLVAVHERADDVAARVVDRVTVTCEAAGYVVTRTAASVRLVYVTGAAPACCPPCADGEHADDGTGTPCPCCGATPPLADPGVVADAHRYTVPMGAGSPPFCSCGVIGGNGTGRPGDRPLLADHLRDVGHPQFIRPRADT